jgi:1,4-alpha-glucan branching enzyme
MSSAPPKTRDALLAGLDPQDVDALHRGRFHDPHRILGAHPARVGRQRGVVVRAFHPDARSVSVRVGDRGLPLEALGEGLFAGFLEGRETPLAYRLHFVFPDGGDWECDDPYRFLPTVGEMDLHLLGEGSHRRLWEVLGAHPRVIDGVEGTAFAVWAPNALRVSVVGDFCAWDGRRLPMRSLGGSGVFELFVPGVLPGALYKYEILTREGALRLKADPFGLAMERPPETASRVVGSSFQWRDGQWMAARAERDPRREPVTIYECHLGSWARVPEEGNRPLGYREIAPRLVEHVRGLGFNHIELLPVAEHAFYGSWGYQITGYYAPTSRYGSPDDLRFLIDHCHQNGVGVILDWVPAHFPRDDFALRRFDGTALFEHDDPRRGEHPDWGTLIFNYGRSEVRNFLVANALYWLREFHIDGLRVDAVASMLYLDYSRKEGEWAPNKHGGRENLEAIDLLRHVNSVVPEEAPGAFTAAEESTAFPGVTAPPEEGGLGFTFKWNMGWMHDTLHYFSREPVYRTFHQDELSFAMIYEYSERYINPISHDEVVHGKRSMLEKMPGDLWQKLANLRALYAYQYTRPGKALLFMGSELAPEGEWNHDQSLPWHLADDPARRGMMHYLRDLGRLYTETPCLWRRDPDPEGFAWVDASDRAHSVYVYLRWDGDDCVLVALNLTPIPRDGYRIGVPKPGRWRQLLSSDAPEYGGSGYPTAAEPETENAPWHGQAQSLVLSLPPLGALVLAPAG